MRGEETHHAQAIRGLVCALAIVVVPVLGTEAAHAYTATQLRDRANVLMFTHSLPTFQAVRNDSTKTLIDQQFDWGSDGCSVPGWTLPVTAYWSGFFRQACNRHDFGYRNYEDFRSSEDDMNDVGFGDKTSSAKRLGSDSCSGYSTVVSR